MRQLGILILAAGLGGLTGIGLAQAQNTVQSTQELQAIRTQGYNAGFRAGVTDYRNHAPYNFNSHPVYQDANQGNSGNSGVDQQTYAMDFRTGFEQGYDDGFYGRTSAPASERTRNYAGTAAPPLNQSNPNTQPMGNAAEGSGSLPAGTQLALKLNNTLSTRSSEPGDSFTASVTAPVYSANGQTLLVPVGSEVQGTVASVQRSGSVSGTSRLQLNFQDLRLPDGTALPLRAEVSQINPQGGIGGAITGTPSTTNEGGVQQSQTRRSVGTAAAGGTVGAIIGAIAGGGKGAGIGGLIGAGLGVVLASREGNLDLPAGTPMTIKLDQPVQIHQ